MSSMVGRGNTMGRGRHYNRLKAAGDVWVAKNYVLTTQTLTGLGCLPACFLGGSV